MNCPFCQKPLPTDIQSAGGKARAAKLSDARRSAIAKKAAKARWAKARKK